MSRSHRGGLLACMLIAGLFFSVQAVARETTNGHTAADENRLLLAQGDNCYHAFWPDANRSVEIIACERTGSTYPSGYYIVQNNTNRDFAVCWTFRWGSGNQSRQLCNSRLRAGQQTRGACPSCSRQHQDGGLAAVSWSRLDPL